MFSSSKDAVRTDALDVLYRGSFMIGAMLDACAISQVVTQVTLDIPDELSAALTAPGRELSRKRFRGPRSGSLPRAEAFDSSVSVPPGLRNPSSMAFLKAHEVWLEYGVEDLERDREAHRNLGL
jgi:hypothetical protein